MPVTRVHQGCPEIIEDKVCGRPIYLDGVCSHCWRSDQTLRGPYNPMRANPAASQIDRVGYKRLHVEKDTLDEKDIEIAMSTLDNDLKELLG